VWLIDWINHRDDAKRRLLEQLEGKVSKPLAPGRMTVSTAQQDPPPLPPPPPPAPAPAGEVSVSPRQTLFRPYAPRIRGPKDVLDQLLQPKVREQMGALFVEILTTESPIETGRFVRHVAASFGFEKVREQRHRDILKLLNQKLIQKSQLGDFVWLTAKHSENYTTYRRSSPEQRDLSEVAPIELLNALADVLEMANSLTDDEAVREVALMFGVEKVTARVREHLRKVLNLALSESLIRAEKGRLYPTRKSK
jgi:hypothetical protein